MRRVLGNLSMGRLVEFVMGIVAVVLVILWRPLFHWLVFGILIRHLTGTIFTLLVVILAVIWLASLDAGYDAGRKGFAFLIVGVLWLFYSIFYSGALTSWYMVKDIQPTIMSNLPDTVEVRYMPMAIAQRYGRSQLQDSLYQLGDVDPYDSEAELYWSAPRVPNGFVNSFIGQTDGIQIVHPDGSVETKHQVMKYGEGMRIGDNISWPLWLTHYNVDLSEVYYLSVNDEILTMVPYVSYRYEFPVMVPIWGGVFVVHPDGHVEDLKPEAAIADPRFIGQRLYPEALAKRIATSWGARHGIVNAWFSHRDQAAVPTIKGEKNQMPYLLPTPTGPMWFIGMEPYGPSESIYKMLFIDARTGEVNLYEVPSETGLIGPNSAFGFVRQEFPDYQWYQKGEKDSYGNVVLIEPRPLIRSGELWWMFTVTTIDSSGIKITPVINARTRNVVFFYNEEELGSFLQGFDSGHSPGATGQSVQTSTVTSNQDLKSLSENQLIQLLQQVAAELARRQNP